MKILLCTLVISAAVMAQNEQLKVDRGTPLQIYNHRSIVQLQHRQKLRRLSRIGPDEAKAIARKECGTKGVHSLHLDHEGQLLFYRIAADRCMIEINALDGVVIRKDLDKAHKHKGTK